MKYLGYLGIPFLLSGGLPITNEVLGMSRDTLFIEWGESSFWRIWGVQRHPSLTKWGNLSWLVRCLEQWRHPPWPVGVSSFNSLTSLNNAEGHIRIHFLLIYQAIKVPFNSLTLEWDLFFFCLVYFYLHIFSVKIRAKFLVWLFLVKN